MAERSGRSRSRCGYGRHATRCKYFGGAGIRRAGRCADALGHELRLRPSARPGVLSAYGMNLADQSVSREASMEQPLDAAGAQPAAAARLDDLGRAGSGLVGRQGGSQIGGVERKVHVMRLGAPTPRSSCLRQRRCDRAAFGPPTLQRFAFPDADRALVIEAVSVGPSARGRASRAPAPDRRGQPAPAAQTVRLFRCGRWYVRGRRPGATIAGPAIIAGKNHDDRHGRAVGKVMTSPVSTVELNASVVPRRGGARRHDADPVMLEVFNNLFMNIAEQMGLPLVGNTRELRSTSGAPGLLVRAVRRRRQPDRQCTPHAGAPWAR